MEYYKVKVQIVLIISCSCLFTCLLEVSADPVEIKLTGKKTRQSSNWISGRYLSSAAIDGCHDGNLDKNCCTHTDGLSGPGWWWVDLEEVVIVNSVKVFNRNDERERLSQFAAYGSNTSQINSSNKVKCGYRTGAVRASYKMTCSSPIMARYIHIQKKARSKTTDQILTLCEVEVKVCPVNTYGQQCKPCGHCQNPQCDWISETGDCFGGCKAGYTGNSCDSECREGTYGIGCQQCSQNCRDAKCDKFSETLYCTNGCLAGKTGQDCSQECPPKTYGFACKSCSNKCKDSECKKYVETTECSNGCEAGYKGTDCSQECGRNTYGIGCQQCSNQCKNLKCEKFSEILNCTDGCIAEFTGQDCLQDCPDKTYGIDCKSCSNRCKDSECEKYSYTTKCSNGCEAGYTGMDCSQDCPDKTYGIGCKSCSNQCKESECEKYSAALVCSNGCEAGYQGTNCSYDCPDKTYGIGCKSCSNQCKESECEKYSAALVCNNGCEAGYQGTDCSDDCPDKTYGIGCKSCSNQCKYSECEKYSAALVCSNGCEAGYNGTDCLTECPDNSYGSNCDSCSPNCKNQPSDKFSTTGICTGGCLTGYHGDAYIDAQTSNGGGTRSNTGATAGAIVVILLIIIVVAIVVFAYRRRRQREQLKAKTSLDFGERGMILYSAENEENNEDVKADKTVKLNLGLKAVPSSGNGRRQKPNKLNKHQEVQKDDFDLNGASSVKDGKVYANVGVSDMQNVSTTQILLRDLEHYVITMESETDAYAKEYEDIPKTTSSVSVADSQQLKPKNRYKGIVPYNNNRVLLKIQDGNPLTDYINASFIKDYNGKKSYIAALGSTDITVKDTWRMIWEHSVTSIFMVTNLREDKRMKCAQYWPSIGLNKYGDITVKFVGVETQDPNIIIRKLKVTKGRQEHMVTQYHYISWPDKQPPLSATSVLKLRGYLKEERLKSTAPVLVHCSAGIGRTGTLIALDILLDQMDTEAAVDIKKCVTDLRHQRTQMVQSLVQYKFLYQCAFEISNLGLTNVLISKVTAFVNSSIFAQRTGQEYQLLEHVKPQFSKEQTEMGRMDYKHKNRDMQVIPAMDHRVKLSLFPEIYINAVYVRGYEGPHAFCATQWPLESTAGDFWKIILQEKSAAIVCMEKVDDSKWFSDKNISMTYQDISISGTWASDDTHTQTYDVFIQLYETDDMQQEEAEYVNVSSLKESDVHRLKMIVLKTRCRTDINQRNLALIPTVYHQVQKIVNVADRKMVTVTCRNGASETGLYIGASILFDMIDKEQQVDVVQVVKQIRKTRPQFITNQEQYMWLYKVCAAYLSQYK